METVVLFLIESLD